MNTAEILQVLPQLSNSDRLTIAQAALSLMRENWQSLTPEQKEQQLAMSAELAILDDMPGIEADQYSLKLEALRRDLAIATEQIENGEYKEYDDHSLPNLLEDIKARGRKKLAQDQTP